MQAELEERDTNLNASRETISSLNHKCKKFEKELEVMSSKKQKYHALFQKQEKLSLRLQNEKQALEEKQEELVQEVQRLEMLQQNNDDLDVSYHPEEQYEDELIDLEQN